MDASFLFGLAGGPVEDFGVGVWRSDISLKITTIKK